jgi:hypothetical protein
MWIVMAGVPLCGFSLYGTFKTYEEAQAAGKLIGIAHEGVSGNVGYGDPWWIIELREPHPDDLIAANVTEDDDDSVPPPLSGVVVWNGDFRHERTFIGPFKGFKTAHQFATAPGLNAPYTITPCALPLRRPVTREFVDPRPRVPMKNSSGAR